MKASTDHFKAAIKAAKKVIADSSAAHRVAYDYLAANMPNACESLLQDLSWQAVLAAR